MGLFLGSHSSPSLSEVPRPKGAVSQPGVWEEGAVSWAARGRTGSRSLPLPSTVAPGRQGSEELFSAKGDPVSLVWNWDRLFKPLSQLREEVTDKY